MMATDETAQDTLRLQFQAMQEMQQRRLQRQMEKRRDKELNLRSIVEDEKEPPGVSAGLSVLQAREQSSLSSFQQRVFEDEIQQLRDQLRETADENGRLYKLLKERDFEIKHLRKKIEEDRFAFTGTAGVAGDVIATKIVELSKRNRMLMAESEGAKSRVKQLNHRIQELERELQMVPAKSPAKGGKSPKAQLGDRILPEAPVIKVLQDRLTAANLKMSELRNQLQSVKQELRMAQKVLASEVGEDVNVQQLLSSPGTWRGRAQQILVLQSKVRELEKQLGQTRSRSAGTESEVLSLYPDTRKLSAQEKNLLRIRALEKEKQEGWEKLAGERDALQRELEETRRKLEAVKSRNKVLAGEVKTLKSQMGTLAEKGRHDDELIDALMDQLKQLQEILGSLSLQEEKSRVSQQRLDQQLNSEAQRSSSLVAQLQAMVAEREAKVRQLELEIGQLSTQYLRNKGMGEGPGGPEANPVYPKGPEDPSLSKPPASTGDHASRLGSSRVEESNHRLLESERQLQEERQRSVVLEQHLEKMRLEPARTAAPQRAAPRSRTGQPPSSSRRDSGGSERKESSLAQLSGLPVESQLEELTTRLAIQVEENEMLRAALGSALQGKEEDIRMYHETLGQVKGVFLQALRQQKVDKR
ncbi:coiled-coil domain-containing protein 13 isoform X3 [Sorex araneus]|uniref:coiled-coil domain-containing protein 13 isoform X3 n=1 Tax=Sorex araneus TaxID=42254 RepID=UPI00243358B4|nr:coiled-coil domain-containing protein 13 isoform X3 [Sorex araneus]